MALELSTLPYGYDALAPHISAETFEFHHGKHHKTYVDKANEMLEGSDLAGLSVEDIIRKTHGQNAGLFNNVAQHFNHDFFWKSMSPNGGGAMPAALEEKITADFGSVDAFKAAFVQGGVTQFGSGWVWLVSNGGKLEIMKTANAENPLTQEGIKPLLVCDVWEHAYYIDYRNARPKFLEVFVNSLANWDFAAANM